jgi:hypothetical protein
MSAKSARRSRDRRNRTTLRPAAMYAASTAATSAVVDTTAMPAPAMPSAGNGPTPKIRQGDSGTRRTIPVETASDGTSMLPVPRMTLASAFISHTRGVPRNTTLE